MSAFSDAVHDVKCPTCGANPGNRCTWFDPKYTARLIHPDRVEAALDQRARLLLGGYKP